MGAAQASDYLENKLIDHLFRAGTFAKPTALWVALFTGSPADAGGGTEVTGGSYARVNLAPSDTNWRATQGGTTGASSGSSGTTANAVVITLSGADGHLGHGESLRHLRRRRRRQPADLGRADGGAADPER